jgi:hypothetical protein
MTPTRYASSKPLIVSLIFMITAIGSAAQNTAFVPEEDNPDFFLSLSKQYEQLYKTDINNLPSLYRKDYVKIYEQRWKNISSKFSDKEIYPGKEAQAYLDALSGEIIKANPTLLQQNSFRCYFSRSGVPNASYIGQGIILFNMGLFEKLNNESEAVFIISHEIAHFLLKHSENAMSAYVNAINSAETQNKLKEIKNTQYGKRAQVDQLVNAITFDSRRHSRDHESDADSLALELMRNTRFNLNGIISTLNILDKVDQDSAAMSAIVEKMFNAKEYPFKKRWLLKEEGLLGGHASIKQDSALEDSLKTHPDCTIRIAALLPLINKYQRNTTIDAEGQSTFNLLQQKFRYEIINYSFNNNYTKSLYYTLKLLDKQPDDPFLVAHTGKIFNSLYTVRKAHTAGKLTDLPAPYYTESYNTLLQFIQNLYAEDISSIGYYFLKAYSKQP